jgi:hypothetical protein
VFLDVSASHPSVRAGRHHGNVDCTNVRCGNCARHAAAVDCSLVCAIDDGTNGAVASADSVSGLPPAPPSDDEPQ